MRGGIHKHLGGTEEMGRKKSSPRSDALRNFPIFKKWGDDHSWCENLSPESALWGGAVHRKRPHAIKMPGGRGWN